MSNEAEVVFCDPQSSAASLIHFLRVDGGLAAPSALAALQECLRDPLTKSTQVRVKGDG